MTVGAPYSSSSHDSLVVRLEVPVRWRLKPPSAPRRPRSICNTVSSYPPRYSTVDWPPDGSGRDQRLPLVHGSWFLSIAPFPLSVAILSIALPSRFDLGARSVRIHRTATTHTSRTFPRSAKTVTSRRNFLARSFPASLLTLRLAIQTDVNLAKAGKAEGLCQQFRF